MLTPAQSALLATDIAANSAEFGSLPPGSGTADIIATAYNQSAAPNYIVWKNFVAEEDILKNGMDWTRVDNLTVGKDRIWTWMNKFGGFCPAKANIRAGINECWSGTAPMLAVRDAIYVHCKRNSTRVEKLLATGSGTTESPSVMGFEGSINVEDVKTAMGW